MHLPALKWGFATHHPYVDTKVSEKCVHVSLNIGALVSRALSSGGDICVFVVQYTFHDAYVSVAFIDESILKKKKKSLSK